MIHPFGNKISYSNILSDIKTKGFAIIALGKGRRMPTARKDKILTLMFQFIST